MGYRIEYRSVHLKYRMFCIHIIRLVSLGHRSIELSTGSPENKLAVKPIMFATKDFVQIIYTSIKHRRNLMGED